MEFQIRLPPRYTLGTPTTTTGTDDNSIELTIPTKFQVKRLTTAPTRPPLDPNDFQLVTPRIQPKVTNKPHFHSQQDKPN